MRRIFAVLTVVGALVLSAPALASAASLTDVIPGGLPTHNCQKALALFEQRVSVDSNLQHVVMVSLGMPSYNPLMLSCGGYSNSAPGTVNTGENGLGGLTSTTDTLTCNKHSVFLDVVYHAAAFVQKVLRVCTGCSNLRLQKSTRPAWHPFTQGTVLHINKWYHKSVKACGATINVGFWLRETIRARTWGQVMGMLSLHLAQMYNRRVEIKIHAVCGSHPCGCTPAVTPPPPAPPTVINICSGSNSNTGSGNAGNCDICSGTSNCGTPPPPPPSCGAGQQMGSNGQCQGTITLVSATRIQEVLPGDVAQLCGTFNVTGDTINQVVMVPTYGYFQDGGNAYLKDPATNKWCDDTYVAPSDAPAVVTPKPLPDDAPYPGNNAPDTYDVVTMTGFGSTTQASGQDFVLWRPAPTRP